MDVLKKVSLTTEMSSLNLAFKPKCLAVLNDKTWVELSLHKGEFPYGMHKHEKDDELFICIKGSVKIKLEDGEILLNEGELLHVKSGIKHFPVAESDCYLIRIKNVRHMEAILENGTKI